MSKPTHILLTYPSQDSEILFRASDGMMIGERQKVTVIYGEDRNAPHSDPRRSRSRVFLEGGTIMHNGEEYPWNDFGSRFLREVVTREDLNLSATSDPPELEIRCQEQSIILSPDSLQMRTNGGGMPAVQVNRFGKKYN